MQADDTISQYISTYRPSGKYDPETVRFPEANSLADIREYLDYLVVSTLNVESVDFKNVYSILVSFGDFMTIVEISYSEHPFEQFNLRIMNTLDPSSPCLHIRIYMSESVIAKLVFVRSVGVACVIPEKGAGTWMMQLSTKIICSLGIRTSILEDDSMVSCGNTSVRFFTLRIYQGKLKSWYSDFGYLHDFESPRVQNAYPDYNPQMFNQDLLNLRAFPLFIIANILSHLEIIPLTKQREIIIEDGAKAALVMKERPYTSETMSLGQYMTKLWKDNCQSYGVIDRFLRTTSRKDIDPHGLIFPWGPLLRRIEFASYEFIHRIPKESCALSGI